MSRQLASIVLACWVAISGASAAALTADAPGQEPYLLSMPDLSSPRATLSALLGNADLALRDFKAHGPSRRPRAPMLRMMATLNTEGVPGADRVLGMALAATRLAAVLAHATADRIVDVPDAAAVKAQGIDAWRVPGTPIVIARVETGPNAGQFLFTPETVALSARLYEAAREVTSEKHDLFTAVDELSYAPGPLIPASVIAALPAFFRAPVYGQAVWQWIGLGILLLVAVIALLRSVLWGLRHDAAESRPFRRYGHVIAAVMVIAISMLTLVLAFFALKIWGNLIATLLVTFRLLMFVSVTWLAVALIQRVAGVIVAMRGLRGTSIDSHLIRVVSTLVSIAVVLSSTLLIVDDMGVPVGPLLAGLGIGGLAVALAVRSTLENVIGGLTLFADRTARVGEFCRIGNESGIVEEIGLRTTKLRRLDDTLITIPNAEMAQIRIENVTRRRRSLFNPRLGLRYETTVAQIKEIEAGILAMLARHPKVLDEGARVRFTGFGDYMLNLDVFAYVDENRLADFVRVQEELNFLIVGIVQRAGAAFAFPSQTNYLARDSTPDVPALPDPPTLPDSPGGRATPAG